MSDVLAIRIEWLDAPNVTTPELAATWARYEIWVGDRCITQVEAADGTFRRSVYGSLYPLAEWIASNWWMLTSHVRPSEVETRYWTWPNVRNYPWLKYHNFRGAGDGMPWPDLTIVAQGSITCICWASDNERPLGPVRFASTGTVAIRTDEVVQGLARLVNHVLERLAEESLPKTSLAEEWEVVANTDDEEREFCRTVAQLGLHPYSIDDQTAINVVQVASTLPSELRVDFFDSADPAALVEAAEWTRRAVGAATRASAKANRDILPLYQVATLPTSENSSATQKPWVAGYGMARRVRHGLGIQQTDRFDISPWIAVSEVTAVSNGIEGIVSVEHDRCGLVPGGPRLGTVGKAFWRARALGRVLARPQQRSFLLSGARGYDERVAGAFAAELLAPADGIRQTLNALGKHDDAAFEGVARHFNVSPLVVRHQYENQIARTADTTTW